MKVKVLAYTKKHELKCITEDNKKIYVDPFVGCAIKCTDKNFRKVGENLEGKTFNMEDYWEHDDIYLCHKFLN